MDANTKGDAMKYQVVNAETKAVDNVYETRRRSQKRADALNGAYGMTLFVVIGIE
jgi:hypothetical protein